MPSARCFALLAGAAVVLALRPAAGIVLDLVVLALVLVDRRWARRAPRPDVHVEAPSRIALDDEATAVLHLRNDGPAPLTLRCVVDVPRPLATAGSDDVRTLVLPVCGHAEVRVPLRAIRRGRFVLGPAHLRVVGPLGLVWVQTTVATEVVLDVVPGLREVRVQRRMATRPDLVTAGLHRLRQLGTGSAFESLRPYVRGDDPRRLDWKATARHSRLIVRQHEAERSQTVMLCIDAGRLMAEVCDDGRQRLDHALASALVLADVARAWRDKVGVLVFSDRPHLLLPPGRALDGLPRRLAAIEARAVEPDYPQALSTVARTLGGRALVVVFSDAVDAEVSGPLSAGLARLGRRHLTLLMALRNPALGEVAATAVGDGGAAYRRAAATELVAARAHALGALRDAGVRVADVAPAQAVPETVRRYLEVKRRGLL